MIDRKSKRYSSKSNCFCSFVRVGRGEGKQYPTAQPETMFFLNIAGAIGTLQAEISRRLLLANEEINGLARVNNLQRSLG